MPEQSTQSNFKHADPIKAFLIPSWLELSLYVVLSSVVILITNTKTVWNLLSDYSGVNAVIVSQAIENQFSVYDQYFESELLGKATVLVVWGLVGCLSYMAVWAVQHLFARVRNDAEESSYEQVRKTKVSYWESRIARHVFIIADVFVLLAMIFYLPLVVSSMSVLAHITLYNLSQPTYLVYLPLAIVVGSLYLYALVRIIRITKYVFGIYFGDTED